MFTYNQAMFYVYRFNHRFFSFIVKTDDCRLWNARTDTCVHTHAEVPCCSASGLSGGQCVFASTHTKLPTDTDAFSCDIPGVIPTRQVQRWHGSIPPLACPQRAHLASLSASTCCSTSQNLTATPWPSWRPRTAVEHRWSWMDLQRNHLYLFHMWFELCPQCWFFSQLMSWACIFVGAGLFTLGIRGRSGMTDDIWIQIFILLSGEFMQADVYSTAPKYLPQLEVHITWTIYDVSHADWLALLQIWCSG